MKKLLSAAAVALLSTAGVAHADNIAWSGTTPLGTYSGLGGALVYAGATGLAGLPGYEQSGTNVGDLQAASPTVTNSWKIEGKVSKDCSYYGGGTTSHSLNFGNFGVNTLSATNVNDAFDMVSDAKATVSTTTAGCNFNNTVSVKKLNGVDGLLNRTTSGFDSGEFTNKLPYTAKVSFTATSNQSGPGAGTGKDVTVAANDDQESKPFGAWRSDMTLEVEIKKPSLALVAGSYDDTVEVTLATVL